MRPDSSRRKRETLARSKPRSHTQSMLRNLAVAGQRRRPLLQGKGVRHQSAVLTGRCRKQRSAGDQGGASLGLSGVTINTRMVFANSPTGRSTSRLSTLTLFVNRSAE